jgi:tRNA(fMet)-specific endonuclease VapC
MGFVVDSSVLIKAARGQYSLDELGSRYPDTSFVIAAITASELLHGVHRTTDDFVRKRRQVFVETALGLFPAIPFDLEIARKHAQLWAHQMTSGQLLGAHDLLIAATALQLGYGVLTANERAFRRVTGLTVVNPILP